MQCRLSAVALLFLYLSCMYVRNLHMAKDRKALSEVLTGYPVNVGPSAIPDFGTHAVALWETMQHSAALHSEPQRESEGPPLYSAA